MLLALFGAQDTKNKYQNLYISSKYYELDKIILAVQAKRPELIALIKKVNFNFFN